MMDLLLTKVWESLMLFERLDRDTRFRLDEKLLLVLLGPMTLFLFLSGLFKAAWRLSFVLDGFWRGPDWLIAGEKLCHPCKGRVLKKP